ncbi:MAG TPA: glycoside hydrolase family 97 catalytic domain-containing protein [Clostridia bacterium]|nr:glycoside hydrolase family 97 catalytic domain-containing protein [Clostridia bacterium]
MRSLKINLLLLTLTILFASNSSYSANEWHLTSSNGKNTISLNLNEFGNLLYSINSYGTEVVKKSELGVSSADEGLTFLNGLIFKSIESRRINESYVLPTGKRSHYENKCIERTFTFVNKEKKELKVICRAYDDGIAFRYVINNPGNIIIKSENTRFNFPEQTVSWMMDYQSNYEGFYTERLLDTVTSKELSYPALMHLKNNVWLLFTEASVYDQPASHLSKTIQKNELRVLLPQQSYTVKEKWQSPWRTFILGNNLGTIVESTLVENLNPPSQIKDMSWIKPGVAVFPWWGDYLANSYIDTLKKYVDMAAEMNWKWIEFDVSLVGSPDHTSKQWETTGWLPEFTSYAISKGINVYGWDEIKVLKTQAGRDYVYGRYKDLGIKGIKIDFIDSDEAYAMRFRDSALRDAAKNHLMVSFHGETLPHGQRRKWPNVMTLEGVRGAEFYTVKGAQPPSPNHNCTLPFTRNVVGPMDYTPVTLTIRPENPRITTYAHELALPFIFESGWTCMADRPAAYLNSPAKDLLKRIETTWDETRFIDGYPGKFICLARRKGKNWYLAAINAGKEREITVPLTFIKDGKYSINIYEDKIGEELTNVNIRNIKVRQGDQLKVKMAENGGFTTIFNDAH